MNSGMDILMEWDELEDPQTKIKVFKTWWEKNAKSFLGKSQKLIESLMKLNK